MRWAAAGVGLLLLVVMTIGVWQLAQVERNLNAQALLSRAAFAQQDRLLQAVSEESAVRAYVASGDPRYLANRQTFERAWLRDSAEILRTQTAFPQLDNLVRRSMAEAAQLQRGFADEIASMRAGRADDAKRNLLKEDALFEQLRSLDEAVQRAAAAGLSAQRARSRFLARARFMGGVGICAILLLWMSGFASVLRRSKTYHLSSLRDPLTGAHNRRGAIAAIDVEVGAAHPQEFGLIFIDLDGFKKVNDAYGHATGDAILRILAARLGDELRGDHDTICRIGGDEFLCVIAPPASIEQVRAIAQRLRKSASRPYEISGDTYVVGCSIGISMYPQHGQTAETLLARADSAMYAAKAAGGGVREASAVAQW